MISNRIRDLELEYTKVTGHTIHKEGHFMFHSINENKYADLLKTAIRKKTDIFTANPKKLKKVENRWVWNTADVETKFSQCYSCTRQDKNNPYSCSKYKDIPKKLLFSDEVCSFQIKKEDS